MNGKRFILGDIHGCDEHLRRMLTILRGRMDPARDRLICLGDYIDRGDGSRDVVEQLIEFSREYDCVFLKGNHDAAFIPWLEGKGDLLMGGEYTIQSYEVQGSVRVPDEHVRFFRELRTYHEEDDFICVHAGLDPDQGPVEEQSESVLLNIRAKFYNSPKRQPKLILFGHTPDLNHEDRYLPFDRVDGANILGLDTGAVFYGRLTCFQWPDQTFIQIYFRRDEWHVKEFHRREIGKESRRIR